MHDKPTDPSKIEALKRKRYWNMPKHLWAGALYPEDEDKNPLGLIVPCLKMRGLWLLDFGIRCGTKVIVERVPEGILVRVAPPPEPKVRKMGKRQLANLQAK